VTRRALGRVACAIAAAGLTLGATVGCGDDDSGRDAGDDVEEVTESAGARVVAEAIRATLLVDDLEEDEHERDVAVIQEAVDDLPGVPEVTGIADEDGDGRDDDGHIEVHVDDEVACLSVSESGTVDVTGGRC
jgi:hypothetical protein